MPPDNTTQDGEQSVDHLDLEVFDGVLPGDLTPAEQMSLGLNFDRGFSQAAMRAMPTDTISPWRQRILETTTGTGVSGGVVGSSATQRQEVLDIADEIRKFMATAEKAKLVIKTENEDMDGASNEIRKRRYCFTEFCSYLSGLVEKFGKNVVDVGESSDRSCRAKLAILMTNLCRPVRVRLNRVGLAAKGESALTWMEMNGREVDIMPLGFDIWNSISQDGQPPDLAMSYMVFLMNQDDIPRTEEFAEIGFSLLDAIEIVPAPKRVFSDTPAREINGEI